MCVYIYIYIYIQSELECGERLLQGDLSNYNSYALSLSIYIYTHLCIYVSYYASKSLFVFIIYDNMIIRTGVR